MTTYQLPYFVSEILYHASVSHLIYQHRGRHKKPNIFYHSMFGLQHRSPSLGHRGQIPVKQWWILSCTYYIFSHLICLQSPGHTFAFLLDLVQVSLSLTFLPVVKKTFPLIVRKSHEACCTGHFLQSTHPISARFKYVVLR